MIIPGDVFVRRSEIASSAAPAPHCRLTCDAGVSVHPLLLLFMFAHLPQLVRHNPAVSLVLSLSLSPSA